MSATKRFSEERNAMLLTIRADSDQLIHGRYLVYLNEINYYLSQKPTIDQLTAVFLRRLYQFADSHCTHYDVTSNLLALIESGQDERIEFGEKELRWAAVKFFDEMVEEVLKSCEAERTVLVHKREAGWYE